MESRKRKSRSEEEPELTIKKRSNKIAEKILSEVHPKTKSISKSKYRKSKSVNKSDKISLETEKEVNNIFTSNSSSSDWEVVDDSVLVKNYNSKAANKILAFDFDSTLVQPKSGATFSKNKDDWMFLYDYKLMKEKINQFFKDGYRIVIISNQSGIRKGSANEGDWKYKVDAFQKALGTPLLLMAALENDYNRKPSIGMWKMLEDKLNNGVKIEKHSSIYVGDAAGREKNSDGKKDHADTDYKFALNANIEFKLPEEFFKSQKIEFPTKFEFDPRELKKNQNLEHELNISDAQEMIILVGPPGSGKSTVVKNYLIPKGYVHVNMDTLKTAVKCQKLTEQSLKEGKSVVVDNTNPTENSRKVYMGIAQKLKIPVRCFLIRIPKVLCFHLNNLRGINTSRKHSSKPVPKVVIHTWYKNFEEPTLLEGFKEVNELPFLPGPFDSTQDEEIFYMYS